MLWFFMVPLTISLREVLVIIAYSCFWGATYSLLALIKVPGYFVHTWNVRLRDMTNTNYWVFTFGVCYSASCPPSNQHPDQKVSSLGPIRSRRQSFPWLGCASIIFVQITENLGIIVALNLQCILHRAIYDVTVQGDYFELYMLQSLRLRRIPRSSINRAWPIRRRSVHHRPVSFGAEAEMKCGFFVMSSMHAEDQESEVAEQVKKLAKGSRPNYDSAYNSYEPSSGRYASGQRAAFNKLDEDAVQLKPMPLEASESTKRLHEMGAGIRLKLGWRLRGRRSLL
ncbi:hypothetical protein BDV11DRAFT_175760 [Aspergillus similis]